MSNHEKQLLIVIAFLVLTTITSLAFAALITGESMLILLGNLQVGWGMIVTFLLISLIGAYQEFKVISPAIQLLQEESWPLKDRVVIGTGLGLYLSLLLLGAISFGADKTGLLQGAYSVTVASLGFSFVFVVMLFSAVVARWLKK